MAMEGVAAAGRRSGEVATKPFRDVETDHHLPHLAHAKNSVTIEDPSGDPSVDEALFQLHPSRDIDESFDHSHSQNATGRRPRIGLIDGVSFFAHTVMSLTIGLQVVRRVDSRRAAGFSPRLELLQQTLGQLEQA